MIPQYGELNRIYRDYIDNYAFSFDRQKFISDFYQEYNDMKSFEAAILELVLDRQKEQYTLILNSLKTEIEKSIQAYETRPLSDRAIERACYQHMERHSQEIEAQLDVTRSLSKPLNEANNRYDSIGYREHTAEEEEQAEKEKVMEAALKNAAEAPLCIMKTIVDTMEMIRVLGEKGSRLAVSDAGVAILFAQAALEGASLNIFINTKMMKDQEEAERLNYRADQLIATGKELKETTYDAVLKGIRP